MINFTDPRLYLKGTCQAIASDVKTGDVLYYSNKFTTGNITTSVTMGEIRAGLGNAIAAIIPSDSALNVEFTAADLSLWAKSAQVGATLGYNAPAPVCQTITADGTSLSIDVSEGKPVAQLGFSKVFCQVQEVGAGSGIAVGGVAYDLNPETGAITGFTATSGKQYKVWYFINKASAQIASISTLFDPKVVHFTAQMAVYANESGANQNEGTRVGWLYAIVPRLKLGGNAGVVGDQSTNDTTSMSGQAVAFDTDTINAECSDCDASNLAYYVYVPDSGADSISGILAAMGGVISVKKSSTAQVQPRFIMDNGQLVTTTDYGKFNYNLASPPQGTTVSATGLITAGATTGDCDLTVSYNNGGETLTSQCKVSVIA